MFFTMFLHHSQFKRVFRFRCVDVHCLLTFDNCLDYLWLNCGSVTTPHPATPPAVLSTRVLRLTAGWDLRGSCPVAPFKTSCETMYWMYFKETRTIRQRPLGSFLSTHLLGPTVSQKLRLTPDPHPFPITCKFMAGLPKGLNLTTMHTSVNKFWKKSMFPLTQTLGTAPCAAL